MLKFLPIRRGAYPGDWPRRTALQGLSGGLAETANSTGACPGDWPRRPTLQGLVRVIGRDGQPYIGLAGGLAGTDGPTVLHGFPLTRIRVLHGCAFF